MKKFERQLESYNFPFPLDLIAQSPASPRDSARLLVLNRKTGKLTDSIFSDLPLFLPKNSILVLNETKVLPARLELRKPTGGKILVLCLENSDGLVKILANRDLKLGETLSLRKNIAFLVAKFEKNNYYLKPLFKIEKFDEVLNSYGTAPIPPYIKHPLRKGKRLRSDYQSIFAKHDGSIAAPTASLHFTPELLASLESAGHTLVYVTLHVGMGTFMNPRNYPRPPSEMHALVNKMTNWQRCQWSRYCGNDRDKRQNLVVAVRFLQTERPANR